MRQLLSFFTLAVTTVLAGCAAAPPVAPVTPPPAPVAPLAAESAPPARLPSDVRPMRYTLALEIVPERDRFSGTVEIVVHLDRPRDVIWLHGKGLEVGEATVTPAGRGDSPRGSDPGGPAAVRAVWQQAQGEVAALRLERPVGPGEATLRLAYRAPFDRQLLGLYRVREGGKAYAFTQFESTYARRAFPCFDEPGWKTPYDVSLTVEGSHQAIANARETARATLPGGMRQVRFATTPPLPTYLVAFAVGPLDVVDGPAVPPSAVRPHPVPLRGVAPAGRGREMAYVLERTGPMLAMLEDYFQIAYPYDKLDLIAIPDFEAGAMENAGAITARDILYLIDGKTAPVWQRRRFALTTAHELAHQWFGNLVTMAWWNDIWLNEAFANWMENRVVERLFPEFEAEVLAVEGVLGAMESDSLVAARVVRQPIESPHDIPNAFDSITYQKGGGVLAMFERWMGEETFRRGIQRYLGAHRHGSATTEDFLAALSQAAGRDVETPFSSFLEQPGVPLVRASLACPAGERPHLDLEQTRFLPVGSAGERGRTWQVPVCARYASGGVVREGCTLLTAARGRLDLEGDVCPAWVMPNAAAAGYYRWTLAPVDLAHLTTAGYRQLAVTERLSLADSLAASFDDATQPAAAVLGAIEPLAKDEHPMVAAAPMELLGFTLDRVVDPSLRSAVAQYSRRIYAPLMAKLGWGRSAVVPPGEATARTNGEQLLRKQLIWFLADKARDPEVRREAARRGRAFLGVGGEGQGQGQGQGTIHREVVEPTLVGPALEVAAQEGDVAFLDGIVERMLGAKDSALRSQLFQAVTAVERTELSARALALALHPRLRSNERLMVVWTQLRRPATREQAWTWLKANIEPLAALLPDGHRGKLPRLAGVFCDPRHAAEARALFAGQADRLPGGPRNLAHGLEAIALCSARVAAQAESANAFFEAMAKPTQMKKAELGRIR